MDGSTVEDKGLILAFLRLPSNDAVEITDMDISKVDVTFIF